MNTFQAGGVPITGLLTGTETVVVGNGGPQITTVTTEQIAALAGSSGSSKITALNTVGAGTITAAGIAGKITSRGGVQVAAFADTTATLAQIIAAMPAGFAIGNSFEYVYENNTLYPATISGPTGVLVNGGSLVVANNSWVRLLVTYVSAASITMVFVNGGPMCPMPASQLFNDTLQAATLNVGGLTGAEVCYYINTGTTPGSLNLPTAAQIIAAIPNAQIGLAYTVAIRNGSGSANTATITTNTGITLNGTNTIAQNVTRTYCVQITGAATITITPIGLSAAGV